MKTHWRSNRKPTGGKYRQPYRKKRKYELEGKKSETTIGEDEKIKVRELGGNQKTKRLKAEKANLAKENGEVEQVEIEDVEENPANDFFARRNIITKGAIIKTNEGKAKVTSRPGQDGIINAEKIQE